MDSYVKRTTCGKMHSTCLELSNTVHYRPWLEKNCSHSVCWVIRMSSSWLETATANTQPATDTNNFRLTTIFRKPWPASCYSPVFFFHLFQKKKPLQKTGSKLCTDWMPFCQSTNNIKVLKETQSTDFKHGKSSILHPPNDPWCPAMALWTSSLKKKHCRCTKANSANHNEQ